MLDPGPSRCLAKRDVRRVWPAPYCVIAPGKPNAIETRAIWFYQLHRLKRVQRRPATVGRKVDIDQHLRSWLVVLASLAVERGRNRRIAPRPSPRAARGRSICRSLMGRGIATHLTGALWVDRGRLIAVSARPRRRRKQDANSCPPAGLPHNRPSRQRKRATALGGFRAFSICPVCDAHAVKAVIDRLKPRQPTLRLFQRCRW